MIWGLNPVGREYEVWGSGLACGGECKYDYFKVKFNTTLLLCLRKQKDGSIMSGEKSDSYSRATLLSLKCIEKFILWFISWYILSPVDHIMI